MDKGDRVFSAQLPATVDHFLTAALHFRVLALYRSEVEVLCTGTAGHGGSGAATQANQHGRAAQHNQLRSGGEVTLLHVLFPNVAVATRDHDGLVVSAPLNAGHTGHIQLEAAKVAAEIGTAEFIVEGGATDGALEHDVQR